MKLSSAMMAVLASLLIIGCATKQQLTPAHSPTKKWEKEQNQY
jgi:outer membrane biogenesis lipoprotein LolB